MKRTATIVVILAVVAASAIAFARRSRPGRAEAAARSVETAEVKPAGFDVTLRVTGVLEAAKAEPIVNWARRSQIVSVLPDGSWLKPGDVVMRLDNTELKKEVSDQATQDADSAAQEASDLAEAKRRLQNAEAGVEKAKDDLKLTQLQSKTAIESATAELQFMEKELEVAQGQLDKRKGLARERLMALSQVEAAEDEVRSKQFGVEKAQRDLEQAKQDAETSDKIKALDIGKAELELELATSGLAQTEADAKRTQETRAQRLADARQQLEACEVKATQAGMLLLEKIWDEGLRSLRVGDQVNEAQRVASVIDPSQMRVRCDISEVDIEGVKRGQRATVQVPAIGGRVLEGSVEAVDNLATDRPWFEGGMPGKRVFAATIAIKTGDKRLRPGMSATVEIVQERATEGVAVPVGALFTKGGKAVVYRAEGERYRELPVKLGARGEMIAAVSAKGLKVGDRVACERPPESMLVGSSERRR